MRTTGVVDLKQQRSSRLAGIAALIVLTIALVFGAGIGTASAVGSVVLAWDANTEPDVSGYKLYYGTASATYGTPITVGNLLTYTVPGLTDGLTYYFAVTAYDTFGNESGYSNEVVYTVPGVPEINLVGNSVSIVDGDTTPSTTDFTDFGSTDITGGTVTRTFTIQNTGTGALTLSGAPLVALSGTNAADFAVTVLPVSPVAAATGNTTFQVRFDPSAAGTRTATLTIANNDANESPYDFTIQGTGATTPEINLLGNAVSIVDGDTTPSITDFTDFGGARLTGGTVTRTFTIQNTGAAALSVTTPVVIGGTNAADFSVTVQPATSIAASGSTTFTVSFDPSLAGTRVATLTITNTDANENPYNFAIQGRGVAPPAAPTNPHVTP